MERLLAERVRLRTLRTRLTGALASLPRGTRHTVFAGVLLLLVCATVLAALGAAAFMRQRQADAVAAVTLQGTSLNSVPAPDFTLADQHGAAVSLSALRGRPVVLTFLDSVCPHADCSLMAQYLTWGAHDLGAQQTRQVAWVAVSLNPWHDSPASASAFLTAHQVSMPVRYLLGTPAQLAPVWQAYAMQTFLQPDGVVIHTTGVYVLDAQGRERVYLPEGFDPKVLSHDLRVLLSEHGAPAAALSATTGLPASSIMLQQSVQGYVVSFTLLPDASGTCTYTVTVQDAQGVPVPGATVTARLAMPTMTMAADVLSLPPLAPGIPGAYRSPAVHVMKGHWVVTMKIALAGGATLGPVFDYSVS
jgi:cytochrome oxidase Cu insertion factor (SCO1/SenC/PrrC family)